MKTVFTTSFCVFITIMTPVIFSCNNRKAIPSEELISQINLKEGEIVSCGPADKQFGKVYFQTSCSERSKKDFDLAIGLLHSFEYDESEKVFAKIIDSDPGCAMAYWGVAMSNFHPLWTPPSEAELKKGNKAIEIANLIAGKSTREADYINALAAFYAEWENTDHFTRCIRYEKAMESLYEKYPDDMEATIFYALALDASADPADKTFVNQKKAGSLLNKLYTSYPDHPGVIHYIIHSYDYPGFAEQALGAARNYARIAPSSAHALHMPSHIFTRLGLWDDCIQSNLASVNSAKCYAEQTHLKGHWDEELHGLDYLVYAYLQKGDNTLAMEQLNYLQTIKEVHPVNFKVAYAFAAIPARVYVENKNWKEAAKIQLYPADFPWNKFPWQESIVHFARLLGAAHLHNTGLAKTELAKLEALHDTLVQQKNLYNSKQVEIQINAGEAWVMFAGGKEKEAIEKMRLAAGMEDATEKHPVTPGELIPARELLADMYFAANLYQDALSAYETVLQRSPNRFNSLYGAGKAAENLGDKQKAVYFYKQLKAIADTANSSRPEISAMQSYLAVR